MTIVFCFSSKQVDQALKQAETNAQITVELRKQTGDAVRLLERMLEIPVDPIGVPSFSCFLPATDVIQEVCF